nr:MAG TPA: YopX protein [Caudoviricetes sp.]
MIPKYRVWDKELQTMLDVSLIDFKKGVLVGEHWKFGETNFMSFDEIELMQSTGLFDKNGKEIFEGDIVRFFDSLYTVFYDIEEGSYRLKPHDDRWVVDYMSNFSSEESFEIIGNIYENKEQLW